MHVPFGFVTRLIGSTDLAFNVTVVTVRILLRRQTLLVFVRCTVVTAMLGT